MFFLIGRSIIRSVSVAALVLAGLAGKVGAVEAASNTCGAQFAAPAFQIPPIDRAVAVEPRVKPLPAVWLDLEAENQKDRARVLQDGGIGRYFFGLLDHRSRWGTDTVPEALRGVETDVDQEIRINYEHAEAHGAQESDVEAEVEWNQGLLNFELEVPWENVNAHIDSAEAGPGLPARRGGHGLGTVNFSLRHPLAQYVSPDTNFDYTLGTRLDLGFPTRTIGNKAYHITPALLHTLFLGDHFSVQARTGVEFLTRNEKDPEGEAFSPHTAFRYDLVLGYDLPHETLPLPDVLDTIPVFELNGRRSLSSIGRSQNELFATVGARFNLKTMGPVQPKIGIGYFFPVDDSARAEVRWGIITSLVFEF